MNHFNAVLSTVVKVSIEFNDLAFAKDLINKFERITEYKEKDYIQLCYLKGYLFWFTHEYKNAIKIYEEAEYLLSTGKQPDDFSIKYYLALALRDTMETDNIKKALDFFLRNEDIEKVADSATIDRNLGGIFYGNIGRCLQFNNEFDKALNCINKSFILILPSEDGSRLINLGYAAEWIAEILLESDEIEPSLYFNKYAIELWKNSSPPLANRSKLKISNIESTATSNSIFSLAFWQVEKFCKNWIKKNCKVKDIDF